MSSRATNSGRARVLACVAVCSLIALACVVLRMRSRETLLPEIVQADAELRAGRWFLHGQSNTVTGWLVEHYSSGVLKARSGVSNGWLEGLSEGWHTNGQKQIQEQYHAGVAQGQRLKWNPDGSKLSEAQIVNGKLHGTFRRWHPDGTLAEEMQMKDGEPDGLSQAYYPSGFLRAEVRTERGKILEQRFWSDGERRDLTLAGNLNGTDPKN